MDDLEARMASLKREYAARLPEKAAACRELAETLLAGPASKESTGELGRALHKLAGSGRTYGYEEISAGARAAERALEALVRRVDPAGAAEAADLRAALAALVDAAQRIARA